MSDITMEDVTCPHCGAQASFTTYPYVDAAREQELKMRCLNRFCLYRNGQFLLAVYF